MINISDKIRTDQMVMGITKTNSVSHIIAKTDKGELTLKINKGDIAYTFHLDAVPYDDKTNRELLQAFNNILYEL